MNENYSDTKNIKNNEALEIIKKFISRWVFYIKPNVPVYINRSLESIFKPNNEKFEIFDNINDLNINQKYDFILYDLPVLINPQLYIKFEKKYSLQESFSEIKKSLIYLNKTGIAIYSLTPSGFSSEFGKKFEIELNNQGYYVNALVNTPTKTLSPNSNIIPLIAVISKKMSSKLFIAELLSEKQAEKVVDIFFNSEKSSIEKTVHYIHHKTFQSFHKHHISQQIEKLETQYKNFNEHKLSELASEINLIRIGNTFVEKPNSIYLQRTGYPNVFSDVSSIPQKTRNLFQIVLDTKVNNEYLKTYFQSRFGKLILDSLVSNTFIPHINKSDLLNATIVIPPLEEQNLIVGVQNKFKNLKKAINEFESELSLNPSGSSSIQQQLNTMLDVINKLSDEDKVNILIREGETKTTEFKETLCYDTRTKIKNRDLETSCLKTVAAFLNTDGGYLLIGVNDSGVINGIEIDLVELFKNNFDKYKLHWKDLLKSRLGEKSLPFIDYNKISVNSKSVFLVKCGKSDKPCFLDGKDFYIRTNPASDKLEGEKLLEYINTRFSN
jgi:hypothetical protein